MHMKRIAIAALAAAALGLSACGGDATPEESPVETTAAVETTQATDPEETAPEETTPAETAPAEEPAEPAGDFPFEEGPVDVGEFVSRYSAAMEGVDQMTITSSVPGSEPSTTQIDNSDPATPRSYAVVDAGGQKMEIVTEGQTSWTRVDEGEWTESTVPDLGEDAVTDGSNFTSVELVSAAERHFTVVMDMSALGGGEMEAQLWLDEEFRAQQTEMSIGDIVSTTTYDYDSPVDIPAVS